MLIEFDQRSASYQKYFFLFFHLSKIHTKSLISCVVYIDQPAAKVFVENIMFSFSGSDGEFFCKKRKIVGKSPKFSSTKTLSSFEISLF